MITSEIANSNSKSIEEGISIITSFKTNFYSFAPIRAKAKRTYDSYKQVFSSEGDHMPVVLKNIISSKSKTNAVRSALESFGKESALFDEIQIKKLGSSRSAPFEINILYNSLPVKITNVGYGISQILPLLIESFTSKNDFFLTNNPRFIYTQKLRQPLVSIY